MIGATTRITGKATNQLRYHAVIQENINPSDKPTELKVDTPDMTNVMKRDNNDPYRICEKRTGIMK